MSRGHLEPQDRCGRKGDAGVFSAAAPSGGTRLPPIRTARRLLRSDGCSPAPAASPESRNARIAALKARLREKMGGDADPPPEEPPLPPPPGPMIGLRQPEFLQSKGISLSGWLEQGMTLNDNHPPSGFNGPVANNDLDREYQMNQLWMTLQRPVTTGNGFDLGGRIDLTYGTDWRWDINNGLENRINGLDDQTYGMMLPQAYAGGRIQRPQGPAWALRVGLRLRVAARHGEFLLFPFLLLYLRRAAPVDRHGGRLPA